MSDLASDDPIGKGEYSAEQSQLNQSYNEIAEGSEVEEEGDDDDAAGVADIEDEEEDFAFDETHDEDIPEDELPADEDPGQGGETGGVELSTDLQADDAGEEVMQRVKRPSSAWMLYMNQNRQRLKEEQPSLTIGEMAKTLSAEYKSLSQELLDVYLDLARKDKERYVEQMSKVRASGGQGTGAVQQYAPLRPGETILPLARLKKTMKCDPAVKNIQKEALSVMAKSTELFIAYVAKKSGLIAAERGVKTVKSADFVKAIHADDILCFLEEDFPLSSLKPVGGKKRQLGADGDEESHKKTKKEGGDNIASGKSSLFNYFGGGSGN